ncbi:MAG: Fic family protein [Akkermansiaceae bacterium]|nr:Fic family protein [Akkermansiaceae bacterium]
MNANITERILQILSAAPQGLSSEEINLKIDGGPRRTLQRKLAEMLQTGVIVRAGAARATLYYANRAKITPIAPIAPIAPESRQNPIQYRVSPNEFVSSVRENPAEYNPKRISESGPKYTEASQEVVSIIRTPQHLRNPTGYRREFLDAYQPNETYYLPEELREKLRLIGKNDAYDNLAPGTHARQVLDRLIIDLSWNSSRLEGNTYSLLETDFLLEQGKSNEPLRAKEAVMLLNHKSAIEFLVEDPDALKFNRYTFLNLHAALTADLMSNYEAEGKLREVPVGIGGSVYHPCNKPQVIEECFDLILQKAATIHDPLECCFFLMVHLPYLQPFEDGNKRTSRLAANIPLIKSNMSPLSFVGVPIRSYADGILAIYELNRIEPMLDVFAWAYEQSAGKYMTIRQEVGEPDPVSTRYRIEIKDRIRDVVVQRLSKPEAVRFIRQWANQSVTASDRDAFITCVEKRLLALSQGNIVRASIRPSEFEAWWPIWKGWA